MSPALAQRGIALAAIALLAALIGLAIASGHRGSSGQKLPERVVYDTSLPTIVPPPSMTAQAVAPPAPAVAPATAQARVRDTFAQYVPAEAKKPEVQRKRKIAKSRQAPPMQFAQPPQMRVAQQSHFGFFGGPSWNNTW